MFSWSPSDYTRFDRERTLPAIDNKIIEKLPSSDMAYLQNLYQQINAVEPLKIEVTCPSCGASVPAGSKFCLSCGARMASASFCPNCGAKIHFYIRHEIKKNGAFGKPLLFAQEKV